MAYLRDNAIKIRVNGEEGNTEYITAWGQIWAYAVAFDWVGTVVNSARQNYEFGETPTPLGYESATVSARRVIGAISVSTVDTIDAAAGEYQEWEQDATPAIKWRCAYRFNSTDKQLVAYFYAKTGLIAGDHGYIKLAVMDGSSEVKSETHMISYAAGYPATPQSFDVDLASGLTNGMLYELELTIWSGGSWSTFMKPLVVEVISELSVE